MTVCHTPTCAAARNRDEYGRPVSVQHGAVTQPVLGATGHHLINRYMDGSLTRHIQSWGTAELRRAEQDLANEAGRVVRYLNALHATLNITLATDGISGDGLDDERAGKAISRVEECDPTDSCD